MIRETFAAFSTIESDPSNFMHFSLSVDSMPAMSSLINSILTLIIESCYEVF